MNRFLLKCARQTQTYRVTRRWYSDRLSLITYHGLTDRRTSAGIGNYQGKHLHVSVFRGHLEYLKRHHNVIPLDRLVEHYERGVRLPPRSVVLTFDDGYQSVYRLGLPLLREYDLPAAFFLATDFVARRDWLWTDRLEYALDATTARSLEMEIGGTLRTFDLRTPAGKIACDSRLRSLLKTVPQESLHAAIDEIERRLDARLASAANADEMYRPVEWAEAREMLESGLVAIGSHTASHVILARCSEARAATELKTSRDVIEAHTGAACTLFCYPNGKPGCFDATTRELVRRAGYRCGLTTVEGLNDDSSDVFELKRFSIDDGGEINRFTLTLSGMMGPLTALQRSARRLVPRPQPGGAE